MGGDFRKKSGTDMGLSEFEKSPVRNGIVIPISVPNPINNIFIFNQYII